MFNSVIIPTRLITGRDAQITLKHKQDNTTSSSAGVGLSPQLEFRVQPMGNPKEKPHVHLRSSMLLS